MILEVVLNYPSRALYVILNIDHKGLFLYFS